MGPVLIISPERDEHARVVRDRLVADGVDARILDFARFPAELKLSLGEQLDAIDIDGERIAPRSVYVRDLGLNPAGLNAELDDDMRANWRRTMAAIHERSELLIALAHRWDRAGVPVYNSLAAMARITKPYQIALLSAAGLPVPETRWTNDPAELRRFAAGRRIAYKPVAGGAATKELTERDLTDERLALLANAPVCFQELLPGRDIRVYVLDGELVAAIEIQTGALDFRVDEQGMTPYPVTDELRRICTRAVEVLGLRFTGMDLKADASGQLKILELNPSPMFLGFDRKSGSSIETALCASLAQLSRGIPSP